MITISAFADEIAADLKVQMDVCQANGVKCIDVRSIDGQNVSQMSVAQVRRYRKRMDDRGFSVPCVGSPIGKIRMDEDFDAHLELLRHCCEVARGFGTKYIRIFSFYPSRGADIMDQRGAVMERMAAMVDIAERADVILLHENERAIYGAKPEGVRDLFATIKSARFGGIFDPGNFVAEGVAAYDAAWSAGLAELTDRFHIKDMVAGAAACCPAGQGDGQFEQIFSDLRDRDWSGYMTLEPHMKAAGQFSGFTGPDLFAEAVAALKGLCRRFDIAYQ